MTTLKDNSHPPERILTFMANPRGKGESGARIMIH